MEIIKKNTTPCFISVAFLVLVVTFLIIHHAWKVKKLEKDIIVLNERISGICDLGIETVKGLENNQNGLIEAFYEIHKLKQSKQEKSIYH